MDNPVAARMPCLLAFLGQPPLAAVSAGLFGYGLFRSLGSCNEVPVICDLLPPRLRSTAIQSDYIRDAMEQSRSKRQVLILDCCHSGAFAQGSKAMTGESAGTGPAFEGIGYGRVVLTATDATPALEGRPRSA